MYMIQTAKQKCLIWADRREPVYLHVLGGGGGGRGRQSSGPFSREVSMKPKG